MEEKAKKTETYIYQRTRSPFPGKTQYCDTDRRHRPAKPQQGRGPGRCPRSPCRRSSSGSSGSGRRSPCLWCAVPHSLPPGSAWQGPPQDSCRSRRSRGAAPPRPGDPSKSQGLQPERQPRLTVAGPGLAVYWRTVRQLRLSDWLRGPQHPRPLGKSYP